MESLKLHLGWQHFRLCELYERQGSCPVLATGRSKRRSFVSNSREVRSGAAVLGAGPVL